MPTYNHPCHVIGDAVGIDMPVTRHSSFPSRPYEVIIPWPVVTISVRRAFFQMNGVVHDDFGRPVWARGVRHNSAPVLASSAVRYDSASLS